MDFLALDNCYHEKRTLLKLSLDEISTIIDKHKTLGYNDQKSYFEVLRDCNKLKMFIDIEHVYDESKFVSIMTSLKEFIKKKLDIDIVYKYTTNRHSSHHGGLSYHVVIQNIYSTRIYGYKIIMCDFISEYEKFGSCIDTSVYSRERLFRLPYMKGINNPNQVEPINADDVHIPEDGDISQYIIQHIPESCICIDGMFNNFNNNIGNIAKISRIMVDRSGGANVFSKEDYIMLRKLIFDIKNSNNQLNLSITTRCNALLYKISKSTLVSDVKRTVHEDMVLNFLEKLKNPHEDIDKELNIISKLETLYNIDDL